MKHCSEHQGFTLVELLVVVVIIAVLAAIALPMYQKAVLKSRFSALMPIAKAMAEGNEAYYLEYGRYAVDPQDLPIQGQEEYPDGTEVNFGTATDFTYVMAGNTNFPNNKYIVYQKHSGKFADNIHCEAEENDTQAQGLCLSLGGQEIAGSQTDGFITYVLSGNIGTDKLPTSLNKLKAQICGTTFDDAHCVVDDDAKTVTTRQCGNNISYYAAADNRTYRGTGCINTVYDADGNSTKTTRMCVNNNTFNDNDECVPNRQGDYERIFDNEGRLIEDLQCYSYDTTQGKCTMVRQYLCPSGSTSGGGIYSNTCNGTLSDNMVSCSGENAVMDYQTRSCVSGNTWGSSETTFEPTSDGSITTQLYCASGATITNGICSEYSTLDSITYRQTRTTDANGKTNILTQGCPFGFTGNSCNGNWVTRGVEVPQYDETGNYLGNARLYCNGQLTADGTACTDNSGWRREFQGTTYCKYGVDWATASCLPESTEERPLDYCKYGTNWTTLTCKPS